MTRWMRHASIAAVAVILAFASQRSFAEDWPRFRGPTGQGISTETNLPVKWSATENVAWKTAIPGEGWSSPIVWGDRVFVTAATDGGKSCHVIAIHKRGGKMIWDVEVFKQTPSRKEGKNSYATPTPVTDGKHVYAFSAAGERPRCRSMGKSHGRIRTTTSTASTASGPRRSFTRTWC